jgi:hypothetical protein
MLLSLSLRQSIHIGCPRATTPPKLWINGCSRSEGAMLCLTLRTDELRHWRSLTFVILDVGVGLLCQGRCDSAAAHVGLGIEMLRSGGAIRSNRGGDVAPPSGPVLSKQRLVMRRAVTQPMRRGMWLSIGTCSCLR